VWLAHTCCAGVHNGRLYLTPQQLAAAVADLHTYIAPCLRWYGLPSAYGSCLLLRGSVYADTILVHTPLVYIVPYSCMLTQLYHDLLRVKLVTLNDNLLRTLDTWQIFGTQIIHKFTAVLFSQILEMLCIKFVYEVSCGILRYLSLVVPS